MNKKNTYPSPLAGRKFSYKKKLETWKGKRKTPAKSNDIESRKTIANPSTWLEDENDLKDIKQMKLCTKC